jgi:CheY-like chemotaxis protein
VVEDESAYGTAICRMLEQGGHEATLVDNGRRAVAALRAAPYDCLLTDLFMPEQEGLETIPEARKAFPELRIVAMSGGGFTHDGASFLSIARALGAQAILEKPFSRQALLDAVAASRA